MVRVFDVDAFRVLLCMLQSMSDNTDNPAGQFVLVSVTQNDKESVDMLVDYVHTTYDMCVVCVGHVHVLAVVCMCV